MKVGVPMLFENIDIVCIQAPLLHKQRRCVGSLGMKAVETTWRWDQQKDGCLTMKLNIYLLNLLEAVAMDKYQMVNLFQPMKQMSVSFVYKQKGPQCSLYGVFKCRTIS